MLSVENRFMIKDPHRKDLSISELPGKPATIARPSATSWCAAHPALIAAGIASTSR